MENFTENFKEIREYYILCFNTFKRLFKEGIDKRGYFLEVFTAFLGGASYIIQNGWGGVVDNFWNFCLSVLVVPGGIAVLYSLYKIIMTPVEIYNNKKDENKKILEEKKAELEKYNWENVGFWLTPFDIIGKSGWALEIKNDKVYEISKVVIEITKIRKDYKNIPLSGLFLLGYVDRKRGNLGDKIVNSSRQSAIGRGESVEYVITSDIIITKSKKTHQFETYPDKLIGEFDVNGDGGVLDSMNSTLSKLAFSLYADDSPPDSITVIEICLKATIDINDEVIILPNKKLNVQVYKDGSLSWYGEDDD